MTSCLVTNIRPRCAKRYGWYFSVCGCASLVTHAAEADTLEGVLERIAHAARELVNARYAAWAPMGAAASNSSKFLASPRTDSPYRSPPQGLGLLG
jgi:hypothetical protein